MGLKQLLAMVTSCAVRHFKHQHRGHWHRPRSRTAASSHQRRAFFEPLERRFALATITVTSLADSTLENLSGDGQVSLREAIEAANTNTSVDGSVAGESGSDTIVFDPSLTTDGPATIQLSWDNELDVTEEVTIDGPGFELLTVNAQRRSRIFNVGSGNDLGDFDFSVNGVTLTEGATTGSNDSYEDNYHSGGAIRFNSAGTLTLIGSSVTESHTSGNYAYGGAIYAKGNVLLTDSSVSNSHTSGTNASGGGIAAAYNVTLTRSVITMNSTSGTYARGGGISAGSVTLTDSRVEFNSTQGRSAGGGGIRSSGAVVLNDSSIWSNRTEGTYSGGGGVNTSGDISLTNSTITDNETLGTGADGGGVNAFSFYPREISILLKNSTVAGNGTIGTNAQGGGIYTYVPITLISSTISGNTTSGTDAHGAGIYSVDVVSLAHSTVTNNATFGSNANGGGISFQSTVNSELLATNSIVAGNSSSLGLAPDINVDRGVRASVTFSLIGNNQGARLTESQTADANGNLIGSSSNPIDPMLSPLAIRGGRTPTHALQNSSPAIDAGDPELIVGENSISTHDQRGFPFHRIVDGDGNSDARIDMGAYEYADLPESSFVVTTLTDEFDLTNAEISLREAIHNANGRLNKQAPDIVTFADGLTGTITLSLGELVVGEDVTIAGPGADLLTIDANQKSRVFNIVTPGDVSIDGLTLTNGRTWLSSDDDFGPYGGAAIRFHSSGTLSLTNCVISESSTNGTLTDGGGIFSTGQLNVTNCTLSTNSTLGNGGGIYALNVVRLTNSTISENTAGVGGGGVYSFLGQVTLASSTVTWNDAGIGGGLYVNIPVWDPVITNTIVAGNRASSEPDLHYRGFTLQVRHSIIGRNENTNNRLYVTHGRPDSNGNIIGDYSSVNARLGPLRNNGGPTPTHALLPGSPAIDAGDNAAAINTDLTNDQRGFGFDRIVDGDIDGNAIVDIGAVEFRATFDFGDLSSKYPVTFKNGGARHTVGELTLGGQIDVEPDGQVSVDATGDGDDDDGIALVASIVSTNTATRSSIVATSSRPGKLDAWIDFNHDGYWDDERETIFTAKDVNAGINVLSFQVPPGALPGDTGARFRLSSAGGLAPTGAAADGEVEDYLFTITDGDTPGGAVVEIANPVPGTIDVKIDGDDMVVFSGAVELFRAPGSAVNRLSISGVDGDDTVNVAKLDAVFAGLVSGDAGPGDDTLRLTGGGQSLDLSQVVESQMRGLEKIDLSSSHSNALTLGVEQVLNLSPTTDTLRILHDETDFIDYGDGWTVESPKIVDDSYVHILSQGSATVEVVNTRPYQNPVKAFDANRDGAVSSIDALVVINRLNDEGSGELLSPNSFDELADLFYIDVNGDGFVAPVDAVQVINVLNNPASSPEGEGHVDARQRVDALSYSEQKTNRLAGPEVSRLPRSEVTRFIDQKALTLVAYNFVASADRSMSTRDNVSTPSDDESDLALIDLLRELKEDFDA